MSQNMELLPCPFCGNSAVVLRTNTHAGMSWVACDSCGLEAPTETGVSAEDAVTYWNRRAITATRPDTGDLVSGEAVEKLAEYIATEWDDEINPVVGAQWPKREGDDGYRGNGGYVAIQPPDVLARCREQAARTLRFISRLSTAPAGDVVVVPREPTVEMLERGYEAYAALAGHGTPAMMDNAYRAMLAAAPTPSPQTSPVTEGEAVCQHENHSHPSHRWELACLHCGVFRGTDLHTAPKAGEGEVVLDLATLKWWRELVDLNPADLAPRLDDRIRSLSRTP